MRNFLVPNLRSFLLTIILAPNKSIKSKILKCLEFARQFDRLPDFRRPNPKPHKHCFYFCLLPFLLGAKKKPLNCVLHSLFWKPNICFDLVIVEGMVWRHEWGKELRIWQKLKMRWCFSTRTGGKWCRLEKTEVNERLLWKLKMNMVFCNIFKLPDVIFKVNLRV